MTTDVHITKISDLPAPLAAYVKALPPPVATLAVVNAVLGAVERQRAKARKPPKPRTRTLVKRAEAATGRTVTAITTLADGATKLDLGTGEQQRPNALDEWIAKHADKTQRH